VRVVMFACCALHFNLMVSLPFSLPMYVSVNSARGCQRNYKCAAAINAIALHPNQGELITGDQQGNVRVWDLTANKFLHDWVRGRWGVGCSWVWVGGCVLALTC